MANEFVAKNGLISQNNTTVSGSLTVRGNQTITGSLIVTGSGIFTGSATVSIPYPGVGSTSPTALTLRNEAEFGVPGTSIEFWSYDNDDNEPAGIFKNSYILSNPYSLPGMVFGNARGVFRFNSYNNLPYYYTGSVVTGSINPIAIGNTLFQIDNSQVSSSLPVVAPSLTLGSGGNLTMGTNGVLIAPTVFNTQTATYTLQSSDIGKTIEMNSGSANNIIIPLNLSTRIGFSVDVIQLGPGQTTVSASAGVTIRSAGGRTKLTSQYSAGSLTQRAINEWLLVGDLTA
jgi:hypothetical protein